MRDVALVFVVFCASYLIFDLGTAPALVSRVAARLSRRGRRWLEQVGSGSRRWTAETGPAPLIMIRRFLGAAILGGLPVVATGLLGASPRVVGLVGAGPMRPIAAAALVLPLAPIMVAVARSPQALRSYPLIQQREWGPALLVANVVSWAVFLLGYELCFRGFLLLTLARLTSEPVALSVMIALYCAVHMRSGAGEAIGAVPVGLLFGWLTLRTGSVWAAWLGHLIIAVTTETSCLLLRTDRRLVAFQAGKRHSRRRLR